MSNDFKTNSDQAGPVSMTYWVSYGSEKEEIERLKKENLRFRQALEQISQEKHTHDGWSSKAAEEIAKKALG